MHNELSPTGLFLKRIMMELGITSQRELSMLLDIPENKISKYLHGIRTPGVEACLQIQEILRTHGIEVSISEIRPRKV
jgi:transcriptional regulator with XRE-family HTH domain